MKTFCIFCYSYLQYSAICARAVRRCLKPDFKTDTSRLDQTTIKVTKWSEGKPGKPSKISFSK